MTKVIIKLSGEYMSDKDSINRFIENIKLGTDLGIQIGIIVGGGNYFRGRDSLEYGLSGQNGDYMGMLATMMNGIALGDLLHQAGMKSEVFSPFSDIFNISKYNANEVNKLMQGGIIPVLCGGLGVPYFTTDTAAVHRAIDLGASLVIKLTDVGGVYDCDPKQNDDANKYDSISFSDAISENLQVMDMTAFTLASEHNISIAISGNEHDFIGNIVRNQSAGTIVSNGSEKSLF